MAPPGTFPGHSGFRPGSGQLRGGVVVTSPFSFIAKLRDLAALDPSGLQQPKDFVYLNCIPPARHQPLNPYDLTIVPYAQVP